MVVPCCYVSLSAIQVFPTSIFEMLKITGEWKNEGKNTQRFLQKYSKCCTCLISYAAHWETIKTNIHLDFRKLFYIVYVTIELQNDF